MAAIGQYSRQYEIVRGQDLIYPLLIGNGSYSAALFLCIGHYIGYAGDGEDIRSLFHLIGEGEHRPEDLWLCHIIRLDQYGDGCGSKVLHIEMVIDLIKGGVLAHHAFGGQPLHLDLLGIVDGAEGDEQCGKDDNNGIV